jgi:polyphenol oxidase
MKATWGFSIEARGKTAKLFNQIHDKGIVEVDDEAHADYLRARPPDADAAFTRTPGVELSAFSADCIPLLFHSPQVVAAVHSGWRGTMRGVVPALLERLAPESADLRVVIGPCIRGCCFEVREDFVTAMKESGQPIERYLEKRDGSLYCRLPELLIETQLSGIPKDRIDTSQLRCTVCSQPRLPSFRRNKSTDPHIRAWVRLD